jgi:hypothetical protein
VAGKETHAKKDRKKSPKESKDKKKKTLGLSHATEGDAPLTAAFRTSGRHENPVDSDGCYSSDEAEHPGAIHVGGTESMDAQERIDDVEIQIIRTNSASVEDAIIEAEVAPNRDEEIEDAYQQGAQEVTELRQRLDELERAERARDSNVVVAVETKKFSKRRIAIISSAVIFIAIIVAAVVASGGSEAPPVSSPPVSSTEPNTNAETDAPSGDNMDAPPTHSPTTANSSPTTPETPTSPTTPPTPFTLDPTLRRESILRAFQYFPLVHEQAYRWLLNTDEWSPTLPFNNDLEESMWVDRYALAVLYLTMGGQNWSEGWMAPVHACQWMRVVGSACDEDDQISILSFSKLHSMHPVIFIFAACLTVELAIFDMAGTLPSEIGLLSGLSYLDIGKSVSLLFPTSSSEF